MRNSDPMHPPPYQGEQEEPWHSASPERNVIYEVEGRVNVDIHVSPALSRQLSGYMNSGAESLSASPLLCRAPIPFRVKLNVLIQIVGSRGDVQPFVALAKELQTHGHRVRLATHDVFEKFVRESDLEFFPIGGNPEELMAYMVKNPGLIPQFETLRQGGISSKRTMIFEMLKGLWASCIEPDSLTGEPFVADAIIANPPSFAHVHCAQALAIPLHIMFTMPWTKTRAFSHPLASLSPGLNADSHLANYLSFGIVEAMIWQGIGDLVNDWRRELLGLKPIPATEGPFLLDTLNIPITYCWSPSLVPRPNDWPAHIDVCGFLSRDAPSYSPTPELAEFLQNGSMPIYISFGSIVIDNPSTMTAVLLEAIRITGVRAIISRGWSRLGNAADQNVLYLEDCPHEWLFQHVAAVEHRGGAGTTACGLRYGRPTVIVPFFGDQPFWGDMVATSGAGPKPLPHKHLTAEALAATIRYCLTPEACSAAQSLSNLIRDEHGTRNAVNSFHKHLSPRIVPCDIYPDRPAAWVSRDGSKNTKWSKLSKLAHASLSEDSVPSSSSYRQYRQNPIHVQHRRWDPISAIASTLVAIATRTTFASIDIVRKPYQEYRALAIVDCDHHPTEAADSSTLNRRSITLDLRSGKTSNIKAKRQSASKNKRQAIAIAQSSALGVSRVFTVLTKGALIDIPVAVTDGLLAISQIYTTEQELFKPVEDCRSGLIVGGKTFRQEIQAGFSDIFIETYKGKRKEGSWGVVKGVSKGVVSLTTKTTGGLLGLVAYPAQGVYRSHRRTYYRETSDKVIRAKLEEGAWLANRVSGEGTVT